jgi:hypothetical protein
MVFFSAAHRAWLVAGASTLLNRFQTAPTIPVYDLQGRRVERVTKAGVYIVNGKKLFIKK